MKTRNLVYPVAVALAVILSTTGCRTHQPPRTTQLPQRPQVGQPQPFIPPPVEPTNGEPSIDIFSNRIPDRITLAPYTIHFDYDSSVIKPSGQANLEQVADKLKSAPDDLLQIEGNCDERGTEEYNRSLGERRALAAREELMKLGIDGMRIRTLSNGKDKPAVAGHDETAWSQNRRDEFVLYLPPK